MMYVIYIKCIAYVFYIKYIVCFKKFMTEINGTAMMQCCVGWH